LTDEHYDLDFHRAMEAAYKRQLSLQSVEVYEADYVRFTKLCTRHNMTMPQMFHTLLLNG
jgi:hypothetical protein